MWTVGLTVEIKLRFRDGLVWTVGLTVEIKLRFHKDPSQSPPFSISSKVMIDDDSPCINKDFTLHYITLHCIALHCIALHYIALHYISYLR